MLVLRGALQPGSSGPPHIMLSLFANGQVQQQADVIFDSPSDHQLLDDVRWLMEDSLGDGTEASRIRAVRVRHAILDEGQRLFRAVFQSNPEAEHIWLAIKSRLQDTRLEVFAPVPLFDQLPWELIRPSEAAVPLCLAAHSFVRLGTLPESTFGIKCVDKCRVLLITSRPSGADDASYRSIASKVMDTLRSSTECDVTFLRPPTFTECARVLRDAKSDGRPFDIIHFDGHGFYFAPDELTTANPGAYIFFENESTEGERAISGHDFAGLVAETGSAAVILNACRSAHVGHQGARANNELTPSAAINSFSHDLINGGVRVVVAMKYNVYVTSALRFVGEFYRQIGREQTVVGAASLARKDLTTDLRRGDGLNSFEIDDWMVPVVFQAGDDLVVRSTTRGSSAPSPNSGAQQDFVFSSALPPAPDLGFVGADDALLAIDRAFDRNSVVLVHGLAGAGKTAGAVEFARWYSITGGFTGPSIFTSFEQRRNVEQILSELEPIIVRRAGPRWPQMALSQRADLGAKVLSGESILWIWDNVDTLQELSDAERNDVIAFLKNAASVGVKFLLTSRSPEMGILGYVPARIELPSLRPSESVEFALRMMDRIGRRSIAVGLLWPILQYCQGNPLTLSIALATFLNRSGAPTTADVSRFVEELHSGEAPLEDDPSLGRSNSLMASLHSGFEALNHQSQRRLALVYLFRTYVNANVLFGMCREVGDGVIADPEYERDWTLHEFSDDSPATFDRVLRAASEVGLLRRSAAQHYWLHPAIQLYLQGYFRRVFPGQRGLERAARAFAESLGVFAISFTLAYGHGNQEKVIKALGDEEGNLRHAFVLCRKYKWWQAEIGLFHGIFTLYWNSGRRVEWAAVLDEVIPDFVDDQGSALPGRERWWTFVMDQGVRLAMWRRDFSRAEFLASSVLRVERLAVESFPDKHNAPMSEVQRKQIQSVGIALARLADILRERGDSECLDINQQALAVYESIEDRLGISIRLFNLGHVFKNLESLRDLDKAEYYYSQSYASYPEHDSVSRAQCLAQLGSVALQRLKDELGGEQRPRLLTEYFDVALARYEEVLAMTSHDDILELAEVHNQLGVVHQYISDGAERAFEHFRLAVHYFDLSQETYQAASTRNNAAHVLERLGRFHEALAFATEALAVFDDLDSASDLTEHVRRLVRKLEREVEPRA